jgi:hypothetical protein
MLPACRQFVACVWTAKGTLGISVKGQKTRPDPQRNALEHRALKK